MLEIEQETRRFTVSDAAELYEVAAWGKGYFSINESGHVCVHPTKDPAAGDRPEATGRPAAGPRHRPPS